MATPTGTVLRPGESPEDGQEVSLNSSAISALEEGDRRSMVATAKQNPRSLVLFRKELDELVCLSETVAAEMTYSLPRSAGQIIGPSIRFAEAVAYCYRNLRAGVEVVNIGKDELTAEGRVYDAERNNGIAIRVNRNIVGKGGRYNQDMIGVTGNAASSIAYRNAVLKYVPKALWVDSWEKAKLATIGKVETIGKKRIDAMAHFNAMGVTDVMVFNTLGIRGVEDIQTDELVALKTFAREIKEGRRSIEDVFGSPLDYEIELTMKSLGWNETQKRISRQSFAGNRDGHLAYVKAEAAKANIVVETTTTKKPAAEKAEAPKVVEEGTADPTPVGDQSATANVVTTVEAPASPETSAPSVNATSTKKAGKSEKVKW